MSDLTVWDSDLIRKKGQENILTEEEKRIEDECDQERYLELYRDIEKEASQQGQTDNDLLIECFRCLEEESKRINTDKNTYNQVGFSYGNSNESSTKATEGETVQPLDDDEYEPFYPSEKLQIPYGMEIVRALTLIPVEGFVFFLA